MQVSNVTNEDGRACAQLLKFLQAARWDLTGSDIDELLKTKRWLQEVASKMASDLQAGMKSVSPAPVSSPTSPNPDTSMKIKNMGPISGSKAKKRK